MEDRAENATSLIESDSVAVALQGLLGVSGEFKGTFTDLLKALNPLVDIDTRQNKLWPQSAQSLSNRIRRAAPALRNVGVSVEFHREPHTRRRLVEISNRPQQTVPSVPTVPGTGSEGAEKPSGQGVSSTESSGDAGDAEIPLIAYQQQGQNPDLGTDEPADGSVWRCLRCGRGFSSRSAYRLHAALASCQAGQQ